MYLFDITKINCSIYLIVKSLYHIIDMCNIKYFICDPVSVTKRIATFSSKNKISMCTISTTLKKNDKNRK